MISVFHESKRLLMGGRLRLAMARTFSQQVGQGVRVGCASGFWGDTACSVPQLVHGGKLHFLVFDYLSEITMSLLAAMKRKNQAFGYVPDFINVAMAPNLKHIKAKGIKVVSNAGGLNPTACALALKQEAEKIGLNFNIAVVLGDDLMPLKSQIASGSVKDFDTGQSLPDVNSMNAYFGANPVAEALNCGAEIVITGRCVDSALVLGPLLHTFKWNRNDWNTLAAGSLAGHVVECGAQSTGGICTDWDQVPSWESIGFPIVECYPNGDFLVTKVPGTGGTLNFGTVAEQILYEIHDPRNYILPDVTCDFANVTLQEVDGGVKVCGAIGKPSPSDYKVSATYVDGFRSTAVCPVVGPRAKEKAEKTANAILKRCEMLFKHFDLPNFRKTCVQVLGSGANYGAAATASELMTREAVLWLAVHHDKQLALEIFSREIAPAGTGMAPGLTGLVGGRPKVSPVFKLFSFLYPKQQIKAEIFMNDKRVILSEDVTEKPSVKPQDNENISVEPIKMESGTLSYPLGKLAYTRSGDKGNSANIGVIARHPAFLPYIKASLTTKSLARYFSHLFDDEATAELLVKRYDVPGLNAINFVLPNALGGGGIASLRSDPQGKALGQILLDFNISNMPNMDELVKQRK